MTQEKFTAIYQRAAERKGGVTALEELLTPPMPADALISVPDDRWLAAMSQKVFQSGLSWKVVRNKWPGFEEVFWGFDIEKLLMMPDEMWEQKSQDTRIIRNFTRVKSIRANAQMIYDIQLTHGSFSRFIAEWPSEDIIGLWAALKQKGDRLGGNTGPYTLRVMGKETFLLTKDIEDYLRHTDIISGGVNSKRSHAAAQAAFNEWQQQSGRSLNEISQIIAFSVGDNRI
ncbi:DNA-3-methyladenine glycosylase I [Thaumasiovibrio subtropicus]|uniref:DNA-3-methyladenine glycosylase I n=1 Tax=Thaumasiovibrio subtropicus TaxID=1891207 RepID=UPI000B362818|nr:DNA-3-methyladenine glycosylase I [Thaumasiovibrio subtropicus]